MPPKRPAAAKQPKGKTYQMAPEFTRGIVLRDFSKHEWRLGKAIAIGGFGRIYQAASLDGHEKVVIKIEPQENGPLFQEMHVYMNIAKPAMLAEWQKSHGLRFLGIPTFMGSGTYNHNGANYRFLVLPLLGDDLSKHFLVKPSSDGHATEPLLAISTVLHVAVACLDALEYMHHHRYVHSDLKAENLLTAASAADLSRVYVVDFGLARRCSDDCTYKEDPRKAHDGTLIFTSIDAHKGCKPTFRGDVEILGYNLLYWLTGSLPWLHVQNAPTSVCAAKEQFRSAVVKKHTMPQGVIYNDDLANAMFLWFEYVYTLDYMDAVDFELLRQIVRDTAKTTSKSKKDGGGSSKSKSKLQPLASTKRPAARHAASTSSNEDEEDGCSNDKRRKNASKSPKKQIEKSRERDSSEDLFASEPEPSSSRRDSRGIANGNSGTRPSSRADSGSRFRKPSPSAKIPGAGVLQRLKAQTSVKRRPSMEATLLKKYLKPPKKAMPIASHGQNGTATQPDKHASRNGAPAPPDLTHCSTQTSPHLWQK